MGQAPMNSQALLPRLAACLLAAAAVSACQPPAASPPDLTVRHLDYVVVDGRIHVFDMDDRHRLIRATDIPATFELKGPRGVAANAVSDRLYISHWGASSPKRQSVGYLLALDLRTDEVLWQRTYKPSIDSFAMTPDGRTIYMPSGEEQQKTGFWFVLDAMTGEEVTRIPVHAGAHNTIVGPAGERAYLASLRYNWLTVVETKGHTILGRVGPFSNAIRPLAINHAESLVFVNVDRLSGFEVGDLRTGKVPYSVRVAGFPWVDPPFPFTQSHGIALTPDEREVWVVDAHNKYLHVFDVTGLPETAPVQIADVPLRGVPKWISFSRDGKWAHVSTGEIIDARSRKPAARVAASRYFLQIDFRGNDPVAAYSRYGIGYGLVPEPPRSR